MTAEKPTVVEAFARVMEEVTVVRKDGRNDAQKFNFRGIDGTVNAVGPALRKHGVIITPNLRSVAYRDIEVGQKRSAMREVTVEVEYVVRGPAGDTFSGIVPGESMDSGDKGTAKAMSVAYRTFLLQALSIPTDEPDPDSVSYERASAREPEPVDAPISAENAQRLVERCEENGLNPAVVIDRATGGRTDDPALVLRSDVPKVKDAIAELVAVPA